MQPKFYIGMPCHDGKVHVGTHISIIKTIELCRELGISLSFDMPMGDGDVGHARNLICANFLRSDFTHLLFIDSDVLWPEQAVIRLYEADKGIVGGAYPKKMDGPPKFPVVAPYGEIDGACQRVMGLGAGFLLIKREAMEKFAAHHTNLKYREDGEDRTDFFSNEIVQGKRASEDISFCLRAKEAGIDVWLRRDIPLGHVGNKAWSACYEVAEGKFAEAAE